MSKKPPQINAQQKAFVDAYIGPARFNATEAAIIAGYSKRSAYELGSRALKIPHVAKYLEGRLSEMALSAGEVLAELADIAKADWREFLEIRHDKDGVPIDASLRLGDKIRALELIGKHHKLFTEKTEHSGEIALKSFAEIAAQAEKEIKKK